MPKNSHIHNIFRICTNYFRKGTDFFLEIYYLCAKIQRDDEMKKEIRFYICLSLGFILMMLGFYTDPPGHISNSVLFGSGIFLAIGAVGVGIDIQGIIHELVILKEVSLKNNGNNKD